MKILVIDPMVAGVAGYMLPAALIDLLGEPSALDPLADVILDLGLCREFDYSAETLNIGGTRATRLMVEVEGGRSGDLPDAMATAASAAGLSSIAYSRALSVMGDLGQSGYPPAETVFSVVGTMLLLDRAAFLEGTIVTTPPVLGCGVIETAYGEIPAPSPATIEILARHRFPFTTAPIGMEMTTPTGAALLTALAGRAIQQYPTMVPVRVGYGSGGREIPGRPDLIRVVEGESLPAGEEHMLILETNLDDASGEVIGYAVERLFAEGAVDVFITPALGKKNRPVSVISVMTTAGEEGNLIRVLMEETGTLGVRVYEFRKVVAARQRETMPIQVGETERSIRVKTSTIDGRLIAEKPEYEDLAAIAREEGIPLRFVDEEVRLRLSERRRKGYDPRGGAGGGCPPDHPNAANSARDE
jgi:uncharacterized protein (DUF111 family)